ncbi:MAG TPA: M20 family metallo-hydrolase [Methanomassiliicoccales archaeon]|nr:M20 family metallo-hydrolase [Methanomassiliicoccales archaeon]HPR98828.1 M20 family metallo-hydrolase [Methanomassiliicoccales archaeon]
MPGLEQLLAQVGSHRDEMVEALSELIRIPAIGPESGGSGELERSRYLRDILDHSKFDDVEMYDALDERVRLRLRPNIVAKKKGKTDQTVWIVAHMDTVPPGDLNAWKTPPFSPRLVDGKLYGLGSEDNGQALIAGLFAAETLMSMDVELERSLGLVLVADEEMGNERGIKFLLKEGVFKQGDIMFVPDHGTPRGDEVEIAEKHILWLKFTVTGKQVHASRPDLGTNAMRVGSELIVFLQDFLHRKYNGRDELFTPDRCTFEPTKRLQTVGNVNTIPGEDVFYFDCRILPQYDIDALRSDITAVLDIFEQKSGTQISMETVQETRSGPPSDLEGEGMKALKWAVKRVKGIEPKPVGIGGGTCANFFRLAGMNAYVWQTIEELAHTPNEYCVVDNLVEDTKVFAVVLAALCCGSQFQA